MPRQRLQLPSGLFALVALASLTYACSGTTFSSSSSTRKADKPQKDSGSGPADPAPPATPPAGSSCVEGDFVKVNWSGPIKDCFDSGKSWNFDSKMCLDMKKAEFDCTWDNILKWFSDTGLVPTEKVQSGKTAGAKLVACGESTDKHRLVVQFFVPPAGQTIDCNNTSSLGNVVTGCYTYYADPTTKPADPANDAEYKKQVYDCMNQL